MQSLAGMPSGDSMSAALLAAWMWDCAAAPAAPAAGRGRPVLLMRALSVIICGGVMLERMSCMSPCISQFVCGYVWVCVCVCAYVCMHDLMCVCA